MIYRFLFVLGMLAAVPAKGKEFQVCNKNSKTLYFALGVYPKVCIGENLTGGGCFDWITNFNVQGWWKVRGFDCRTVTYPDKLGYSTVYLAALREGKPITDYAFKTEDGERGGHHICSNETKAFAYVNRRAEHSDFSKLECKQFNKTEGWRSSSTRGSLYGSAFPYVRLDSAGKYQQYTFNFN